MRVRIPGIVTMVVSLFIVAGCNPGQEEETLSINIGGYDYDRTGHEPSWMVRYPSRMPM